MRFEIEPPDFARSPFTGMVRRHWVAAARHLLEGVFAHVRDETAPIVFPKKSAGAYPATGAPWFAFRAEEFEGLARTLLVAAPLLENDPELRIGGRGVRAYYAQAILRACDPRSAQFVGWPEDIARANGGKPAQQLVEMAGLCVGLMSARQALWERYAAPEKEIVLCCLRAYATARTHPHNWRFFNVLVTAFLHVNGEPVDEAAQEAHLAALLAFYAGDGWYRDGSEFDYYSAWAFQFYGPLWCEWVGYRTRPALAARIERQHAELMANYPWFFGRAGESLLWGRSATYRCAASAPLVVAFKLRTTPLDPGWARRIASGNLRQFLGREEFWDDGIPSLGFYGAHEAVLQRYSCAASPFWLGKIFHALTLPQDSPFWTAVENEGVWPELGAGARSVVLPGPGLTATLHGATGAAEICSGKISQALPWYQRLAFSSAFPWEAEEPAGGTAMGYSLRRLGSGETNFVMPSIMRCAGMRDGAWQRQIVFNEPWLRVTIDLAEIRLPDGGTLRVDRVRALGAFELRLGQYGLPLVNGREPELKATSEGARHTCVARIESRAVMMTAYQGWDRVECLVHRGKNVEAETSCVVQAGRRCESSGGEVAWCVTLFRNRTDAGAWSAMEIDPIAACEAPGADGEALCVRFKDGREWCVDFAGIEGRLDG